MKSVIKTIVVLAIGTLGISSAGAQNDNAAAESGPPVLAKDIVPARFGTRLYVTSSAFYAGGTLDDKYTQNGENMSPPIAWAKGPTGTRSYVVLLEDSGVNRPDPIVHWIIYNLPSTATRVGQEIPTDETLSNGAMQGKNVRDETGYIGPKPPAGQTHPYHFEVFALNTRLDLDPETADRDAVLEAMKSHVIASGNIVANYTGK